MYVWVFLNAKLGHVFPIDNFSSLIQFYSKPHTKSEIRKTKTFNLLFNKEILFICMGILAPGFKCFCVGFTSLKRMTVN